MNTLPSAKDIVLSPFFFGFTFHSLRCISRGERP